MKIIGLLLVLLGGLVLGYDGFEPVFRETTGEIGRGRGTSWYVPPVIGGIALVSGLLILATSCRRDDN